MQKSQPSSLRNPSAVTPSYSSEFSDLNVKRAELEKRKERLEEKRKLLEDIRTTEQTAIAELSELSKKRAVLEDRRKKLEEKKRKFLLLKINKVHSQSWLK